MNGGQSGVGLAGSVTRGEEALSAGAEATSPGPGSGIPAASVTAAEVNGGPGAVERLDDASAPCGDPGAGSGAESVDASVGFSGTGHDHSGR